jgi:hypothetical protein
MINYSNYLKAAQREGKKLNKQASRTINSLT